MEDKFKLIAENKKLEYCYLKLAEECNELGEALIKQITKPNGADDRIPHLIEEIGDVITNCNILIAKLNISDEVNKRIRTKLKTVLNTIV